MEMFDYLCQMGFAETLAERICLFCQVFSISLEEFFKLSTNNMFVEYPDCDASYERLHCDLESYNELEFD